MDDAVHGERSRADDYAGEYVESFAEYVYVRGNAVGKHDLRLNGSK